MSKGSKSQMCGGWNEYGNAWNMQNTNGRGKERVNSSICVWRAFGGICLGVLGEDFAGSGAARPFRHGVPVPTC